MCKCNIAMHLSVIACDANYLSNGQQLSSRYLFVTIAIQVLSKGRVHGVTHWISTHLEQSSDLLRNNKFDKLTTCVLTYEDINCRLHVH